MESTLLLLIKDSVKYIPSWYFSSFSFWSNNIGIYDTLSTPIEYPWAITLGILFCLTKKNPFTLYLDNSVIKSEFNVNLRPIGSVASLPFLWFWILILGNLNTPLVLAKKLLPAKKKSSLLITLTSPVSLSLYNSVKLLLASSEVPYLKLVKWFLSVSNGIS